jgi:hypothetical protein
VVEKIQIFRNFLRNKSFNFVCACSCVCIFGWQRYLLVNTKQSIKRTKVFGHIIFSLCRLGTWISRWKSRTKRRGRPAANANRSTCTHTGESNCWWAITIVKIQAKENGDKTLRSRLLMRENCEIVSLELNPPFFFDFLSRK